MTVAEAPRSEGAFQPGESIYVCWNHADEMVFPLLPEFEDRSRKGLLGPGGPFGDYAAQERGAATQWASG